MKVLITGSRGFIGQNLLQFLKLKSGIDILEYNHKDKVEKLKKIIQNADFIFHLAGINRTYKKRNYLQSNYELTKKICNFNNLLKFYLICIELKIVWARSSVGRAIPF